MDCANALVGMTADVPHPNQIVEYVADASLLVVNTDSYNFFKDHNFKGCG